MVQYQDIFDKKSGVNKIFIYKIQLEDHKVVNTRQYLLPISRIEAVQKELQKWIDWGIIENSKSQYCKALHIVDKADDSVRPVFDLRELNKLIIVPQDHVENINNLLTGFHGAQYFFQIRLIIIGILSSSVG